LISTVTKEGQLVKQSGQKPTSDLRSLASLNVSSVNVTSLLSAFKSYVSLSKKVLIFLFLLEQFTTLEVVV